MSRKLIGAVIIGGLVTVLAAAGLFGSYLSARRIIRPAPGTTLTVPALAYAPSPYQTDATPCLTASGTRVRNGTVAANFLPMGTILEIDGDYFIVEDRMHPRYNQAIDVFKPSSAEARKFGQQTLAITIINYGTPGQPLPGDDGALEKADSKSARERAEAEGEPNVFEQWLGGLHYVQRLLKAGASNDVNRYDVNCFDKAM
jgi:3D (Asp-Asp-Asp) domain-containing protein